jgi:hypothetical protein
MAWGGADRVKIGMFAMVAYSWKCCVEACLIDRYLYTRVAVRATSATPLPMWGVEGSGMVP